MRFKRFNRLSALAAGLCLAAVAAAAPAWAAGASPDSPDPYALEAPAPGAALTVSPRAADSGSCGKTEADHLTWTLTQETDGWWTLTISGSGAMADYTGNGGPWVGTRSSIKTIVLPEGLTSIGSHAFDGYSALASVTIPEGVETIGEWAFQNCPSLEELTIPESVTSIGEWAFTGCTALPSVTVPGGVKTIENHAFYNCKSLTELVLSEGVTSIGEEAFCLCESLASVSVPSTVTEIDLSAFSDCPALETFTVASGNKAYSSRDGFLLSGDGKELFACLIPPEGDTYAITVPDGVEIIGDSAFLYCESLASVTFPASLKTIGSYAFYGCTGLAGELTLPEGVEAIGSDAFDGCSELTSVAFSSAASLKIIGNGAFYGCSGLTAVSLPASLTFIGGSAFDGCESLETVVYTGTGRLADLCEGGLEGTGFGEGLTFRYAAAIQDGGTGASGAAVYTPGDSVTLAAGTKTGYTFDGWTVSGVTLTEAQLKAPELTFTMPDGPVTASANWALPSADSVSQTGSTVTLTFPGAAPADGALVLAALDGTAALPGTYDAARSEVSFQKPLESGRKLFFLDPDTLIPLAKPAVVG